jgi:hypothetical protein
LSDEANVGLSNEPADTTLDSILDSAIENAAKASDPEVVDDKTEASDRARDEKGRFAPKDSAAKASEPEQAETATTADIKTEAQPAQVQPVEPPHTWSADEKAKFASWPRDVQEHVVARYKAMEADYTRKTQETAEFRRSAEPLLNAIKPFDQYLSQVGPSLGRSKEQLITDLLATEYRLRTGSAQEKYAALAQITQTYGIDLAALAGGQVPQPDPAYQQLASKLQAFEEREAQREAQVHQQQAQQALSYLESLKVASDEHGKPKYPLFEQVRYPVAKMLENGEATTYDEAYQKAAAPINALIATELENRAKQADTQRKEAVAKAEKAAPVRSSGSQPGGSAKSKDLDSILETNISRHFG